MRKVIAHIRWLIAHWVDPAHIEPEITPAHLTHYWVDELDPTDPRDTYREGD